MNRKMVLAFGAFTAAFLWPYAAFAGGRSGVSRMLYREGRESLSAHFAQGAGIGVATGARWLSGNVARRQADSAGAVEGFGFEAPPPPLASLKDVRPRLHLTATRVEVLRDMVGVHPEARELYANAKYRELFDRIRQVADRGVRTGPPEYVLDDGWSGRSQLWQRSVGEMIPHLALAYLMTGEAEYLESAREWILASCGYETWGLPPLSDVHLAAAHQLYGLAVAYDWLYDDLDEATKQVVRECMEERAAFMFRKAVAEEVRWHRMYIENQLWVNTTALAAAGMAFYGQVEGADDWIALALAKYEVTFDALGSDGASHEGVGYWGYGVEYMLKFMDLADSLLDRDFFTGQEWFANTAFFRLYASLPRDSWERQLSVMTFADSRPFDWYGPEHILRLLASRYRCSYAQWLADVTEEAGICGTTATFLNLLWYDPSVAPERPADLPGFRHFNDMDIVYGRSGWHGSETVWAFKCGPHIGHKAIQMFDYDPGGGHVHPDAGSFQVFSYGEPLVVSSGYTWKATKYQNTALVNGLGQKGDDRAWFLLDELCRESRGARILAAVPGERMDYVIGDVTDAYRSEAGLRSFLRHFHYIRPATWVIVDEFEARQPSTFELLFHGASPFEKRSERTWRSAGEKAALNVRLVAPADAEFHTFRQHLKSTSGELTDRHLETLKAANHAESEHAVFVTVLSAAPADETEVFSADFKESEDADILVIESSRKRIALQLNMERDDPSQPVLSIVD